MKIILRFLIKNIKEKKLRSLLVILAICVATALFFATSALKSNLEVELKKVLSKSSGDAEISISADRWSPSGFFRLNHLDPLLPRIQYAVGLMDNISGVYKTDNEDINFSLAAIDSKDINTLYSLQFSECGNLDDFYGRKIIISASFARQYSIACNDVIKMQIDGRNERLQVIGIANSTGPFRDDGHGNFAIIPLILATKAFYQLGKVTRIYIKINPGENIQQLMSEIRKLYPRQFVNETVEKSELDRFTSEVTTPYNVMLILIIITSIYIIFTSFQVITRERLPVIGTFRSIGATKRATSWLFYLESLIYGIIGGVIGVLVGIAVLYIMGYSTAKSMFNMKTYTMYFSVYHVLKALIMAMFISFISSLIPILSLRRIPAKDIILGTIAKNRTRKKLKIIIGSVFIFSGVTLPNFISGAISRPVNIASIILVIFGLVFFSPVLISLFTRIFARPFTFFFGNIGMLAVKNLKANKKMQNNIALLTIGLSSLIMISTINQSIQTEVLQIYTRAKFELMSWIWPMDRRIESKIQSVEGVEQSMGIYNLWHVEAKNKSSKILNIQGINTSKYLEFWDYPLTRQQLNRLDSGRYIIAGYGLKAQLKLNVGDEIELLLKHKYRKYKVIGFFQTMWMNGRTMIVSDKYLKQDADLSRYGHLYIMSSLPQEQAKLKVKKYFSRVRPWVETVDNLQKNDLESNGQMMAMLTGFSVLSMIIGIIGIINNFLLSFLDRKRNLAILKSQGMSVRQMIKMIFIESLAEGILGAVIGICGGFLMLSVIPPLLISMEIYLHLHFSLLLFIIYAAVGVFITLAASVSPALKSSKLNTIQALKYE